MKKAPSAKQKVAVYESVFDLINLHRTLTENEAAVEKILKVLDTYAAAKDQAKIDAFYVLEEAVK